MANYLTMQDVVLGYMVTVILVELPDIKLQVKIKETQIKCQKSSKMQNLCQILNLCKGYGIPA